MELPAKRRHRSSDTVESGLVDAFRALDPASADAALDELADCLTAQQAQRLVGRLTAAGRVFASTVSDVIKRLASQHNERVGWACLPPEVLSEVIARLGSLRDLHACSATCVSWHRVVWSSLRVLPGPIQSESRLRGVIASCPGLLALQYEGPDTEALNQLTQLTSLTALQLRVEPLRRPQPSDESAIDYNSDDSDYFEPQEPNLLRLAAVLPSLPSLTSLRALVRLADEDVMSIAACSALRYLQLSERYRHGSYWTPVQWSLPASLEALDLRYLSIGDSRPPGLLPVDNPSADESGLPDHPAETSDDSLSDGWNPEPQPYVRHERPVKQSDAPLDHLFDPLRRLTRLTMETCYIRAGPLQSVSALTSLRVLSLPRRVPPCVSTLTALESLVVRNTFRDFALLSPLQHLTHLAIDTLRAVDVPSLVKLRQLRSLSLNWQSGDNLDELESSMPWLAIHTRRP